MDWNDLLTLGNFQLAWRRIRNSAINTTKDRLGLKVFSIALETHLEILINDILERRYKPSSPSIMYLPKKSGRLRPFTLLSMRDRLVYQAIGNILIYNTYAYLEPNADKIVFSPVLTGKNLDYVFMPSLRKGEDFEGQFLKFTRKQAEITNSDQFSYVVNADIASFYPSIDHSLLISKLMENGWLDNKICKLLVDCLAKWTSDTAKYTVRKSLPIGYETSDLLANLFLKEIDEMFVGYEYLRYVDDMRVYAETKEDGEKILNQLDVALQSQGLILNGIKSKVENLSDLSIEAHLKHLEEQQLVLSDIDRSINSPIEAQQEAADKKLRTLLIEILDIKEWNNLSLDEIVEPSEETSLFFSLYRLREKNIQIRDLSISLLATHPHRSYAIVRYLTLFVGDQVVLDALWDIILDESKHGQVRADCLRGVYNISDELEPIQITLRDWIRSDDDLTLSLYAVEIIQQFAEEKQFLLEMVDTISTPHLRYAIISTVFTTLETNEERLKLIYNCLKSDDYIIISLGVYFVSTRLDLLDQLNLEIEPLAEQIMQNVLSNISIQDFRQNLSALFGVQITTDSLDDMPQANELNQLVTNMILARETNRDEYLRNLTDFLGIFSNIYQVLTGNKFTSLIPENGVIKDAFDYTKIGLMNLSEFKSSLTFLGTRPALGYVDTEKLHEGISKIINNAFAEIRTLLDLTPEVEKKLFDTNNNPSIPLIFFSYSHLDDREHNVLKRKLRYLEIQSIAQLWSDTELRAGEVWKAELEEKLNASQIVLFLISSHFMGSQFINDEEMPLAIINYKDKKTVCIPVILEDCDWDFAPYKHLQAVPTDAKPITQWTHPDSAYKSIQVEIRKVLNMLDKGIYSWKKIP